MQKKKISFKNKILILVLFLLCVLFVYSLFKNIAYPLLWNDEAETTMFATRILEYGYPKVDDGKNVLYLLELPQRIGVNQKTDAYIGAVWGQYYFSAVGTFLAKQVDDLYTKTAILRIPFALIGLIGLAIIALSVINFFKENLTNKLVFLIFFIFLELLSISLVLHLREVRYYSLVIFLSSCIFYTYINYRFIKKINSNIYILATMLLLVLLFNTFPPAYFIFIATIGAYECFEFLKKTYIKDFAINTSPILVSLITIIPFLVFFKNFHIAKEYTKLFHVGSYVYYIRISEVLNFFGKYEFLYLVLVAKVILAGVWFYCKRAKIFYYIEGKKSGIKDKQRVSNFLTLFFVVYVFMVTRIPLNDIYERYYILLQPVLIIILLLDIFTIFELVSNINSLDIKKQVKEIIVFLICATFLLNGFDKIDIVKNHMYELFHQYKGPLDFAIPYIKANYKNTENLVVATNYEECSYMYYLNSKVIIGFVGNNLEEDLKMQPDIIIFRKRWAYVAPYIFNSFFQKGKYKKISFPVFDYLVNNIPEMRDKYCPHLYKTRMAKNEAEALNIYIKQR